MIKDLLMYISSFSASGSSKFISLRAKFRRNLDEVENEYHKTTSKILKYVCLKLNSRGVNDLDDLTNLDIIAGITKLILLVILADIILVMILNSLYQAILYIFGLYVIPAYFIVVIDLTSIAVALTPRKQILINVEHNIRTVSRVMLTSIYISIITVNILLIQIIYELWLIFTDPFSAHSFWYVFASNFIPSVFVMCIIYLSKYSACILCALQKNKISSFFN